MFKILSPKLLYVKKWGVALSLWYRSSSIQHLFRRKEKYANNRARDSKKLIFYDIQLQFNNNEVIRIKRKYK